MPKVEINSVSKQNPHSVNEFRENILEVAIGELEAGKTKYTRGAGSMELCQGVADYLSKFSPFSENSN